MKSLNLLAFDLGASNGRAMLARFDGERMLLRELHRFENPMREDKTAHCWDATFLTQQLKLGFSACRTETRGQIDCFGIDTWGVDFGLLDKNGELIENPRCYRDATDRRCSLAGKSPPRRRYSSVPASPR